jgi:hypothetical protein
MSADSQHLSDQSDASDVRATTAPMETSRSPEQKTQQCGSPRRHLSDQPNASDVCRSCGIRVDEAHLPSCIAAANKQKRRAESDYFAMPHRPEDMATSRKGLKSTGYPWQRW